MELDKDIYSIKKYIDTEPYYKRKIDYLREKRNKLLQETDFYFLADVVIDENKLNIIKKYRQDLRDIINKLVNDEIICNIIEEDIDLKYFPKLVLDGEEKENY